MSTDESGRTGELLQVFDEDPDLVEGIDDAQTRTGVRSTPSLRTDSMRSPRLSFLMAANSLPGMEDRSLLTLWHFADRWDDSFHG